MKRLKLFPKIFLYTLAIMLFVVVTHGLIYLLAPRMQLAVSTLVHRCTNSRVNSTRYPRHLHACKASRRHHYAVASQTHS